MSAPGKSAFSGICRSILLVALALLPVPPAHGSEDGAEIQTVRASGNAAIEKGDLETARKNALLDAKRTAVEQVGTRIVSETVVENFLLVKDRIATKADGYVHGFKILKEAHGEGGYLVEIEASVSSRLLLEDALSIYRKMNRPRVMVAVLEGQGNAGTQAGHAESVVAGFFAGKEFTLVDPAAVKEKTRKDELRKIAEGDTAAAAKIGLDAGAEVVVAGIATPGEVQTVRDVMFASKATCSARAIRTSNASLYAVATQSKSAADGIADGAKRKAVDLACTGVAKELFWKIIKKWNEESMGGAEIEIVVSGVNFARLGTVIEAVRRLEGVGEVLQRSFDSPVAVLGVNYRGDAMQLGVLLDKGRFDGFGFEVLTVTPGKINVRVR